MVTKKICVLTTGHDAADTRIYHKQIKSLAAAGFAVTLIAQAANESLFNAGTLLRLQQPPSRLKRIIWMPWTVLRKALSLQADLYHFHDPELIPVGILLRLAGKKVIYDVHEDVPKQILGKTWIRKPIRHTVSKLFNVMEKNASRVFTAVIPATPSIAANFTGIAKEVITVQNFPLLNELSYPVTQKEEKENTVVFVGGITESRGIRQMVQAVGYLPDEYHATLILGGKFIPASLEHDLQIAENPQIHYLGWLDRQQVAKVFAGVKAGLVLFNASPNHINAQPNKMFEYMSAGLPVIASHFTLWKEIIEGNNCGLTVDPEDPQAIAQAMRYIFDNPEAAAKMGENGKNAVEQKYNWSVEEEKLIQLYKKLLGA